MKKRTIVGIALALGMVSFGAMSALAANSCCNGSNCAEKKVVEKFGQDTAGTKQALKAKELELQTLYGYDTIDNHMAADLEAEIRGLKGQLPHEADQYGIKPCCLS